MMLARRDRLGSLLLQLVDRWVLLAGRLRNQAGDYRRRWLRRIGRVCRQRGRHHARDVLVSGLLSAEGGNQSGGCGRGDRRRIDAVPLVASVLAVGLAVAAPELCVFRLMVA